MEIPRFSFRIFTSNFLLILILLLSSGRLKLTIPLEASEKENTFIASHRNRSNLNKERVRPNILMQKALNPKYADVHVKCESDADLILRRYPTLDSILPESSSRLLEYCGNWHSGSSCFVFEAVPSGQYQLIVTKKQHGYHPQLQEVTVQADQDNQFAVKPFQGQLLVENNAASFIDSVCGVKVTGVTDPGYQNMFTAGNIIDLPLGIYTVSLGRPGMSKREMIHRKFAIHHGLSTTIRVNLSNRTVSIVHAYDQLHEALEEAQRQFNELKDQFDQNLKTMANLRTKMSFENEDVQSWTECLKSVQNTRSFAKAMREQYPFFSKQINGYVRLGAFVEDIVWNTWPIEKYEIELNHQESMTFIKIPAGTYLMGNPEGGGSTSVQPNLPSEQRPLSDDFIKAVSDRHNELPQKKVVIDKPFYISRTEVTVGQWLAIVSDKPWKFKIDHFKKSDYANYADWIAITEYCEKLSKHLRAVCRLPTEAEWEYVAKAGCRNDYSHPEYFKFVETPIPDENDNPYGSSSMQGISREFEDISSGFNISTYDPYNNRMQLKRERAYLETIVGRSYAVALTPNPSRIPTGQENAWGVVGMGGDVCELCSDEYVSTHPQDIIEEGLLTLPSHISSIPERYFVVKGCCNESPYENFHPSWRACAHIVRRSPYIGFRIVMEKLPSMRKNQKGPRIVIR